MRSLIRAMIALLLLVGSAVVVTASPANADGINCSVPPGYTYDGRRITRCIDTNGVNTGVQYALVIPATGVWACRVPAGFTFTQQVWTDDCDGRPGANATPLYLLQAL